MGMIVGLTVSVDTSFAQCVWMGDLSLRSFGAYVPNGYPTGKLGGRERIGLAVSVSLPFHVLPGGSHMKGRDLLTLLILVPRIFLCRIPFTIPQQGSRG
jgi:hypothetical protein